MGELAKTYPDGMDVPRKTLWNILKPGTARIEIAAFEASDGRTALFAYGYFKPG